MRILQNVLWAPLRASQRAFTLIEILVAVAIIAILVVVAVPAYSTYATKSKFSEVVTATNPIKTFVSTCAMDGECVSGGVILMPMDVVGGLAQQTLIPPMQAFATSMLNSCAAESPNASFPPGSIQHFADLWSDPVSGFTVTVDPNNHDNYCMIPVGATGSAARCADVCTTPDHVHHLSGPATMFGSAYVNVGTKHLVVPCIGTGVGCSPGTKYVMSASSDNLGVITSQANFGNGLLGETFILTPQLSSGRVDWVESGSCKTRDGGPLC